MDNYALLAFIFLAVAAGLMVAEFFIPSAGVLFLTMVVCVCFSTYYAYLAWFNNSPNYFGGFVLLEIVVLPSLALATIYILPKTSFGKRILLEGPQNVEDNAYKEEEEHLSTFIGQIGEATSRLNPGGMMRIQNERVHCYTDGSVIDRGEPLIVIAVSGTRLVVRKADTNEISQQNQQQETKENDSSKEETRQELTPDLPDGDLDFDLPKT